jgi:transcriptional regulator with XRE-family HTH domain
MDEIKRIGYNLKQIRQSMGMSQKSIGMLLGVTFQQIQKYENGINRFPVDKMFHLKVYFNLSYDRFFHGLNVSYQSDVHMYDNDTKLSPLVRACCLKNKTLKNKIEKIVEILLS